MPILHVQYPNEAQDQSGNKLKIKPQKVLESRGPILQVNLSVASAFADQLLKENKPVPQAITGFALLDTGASCTCIDDDAAKKLGLPVIDKVKMSSASHNESEKNVYPAIIEVLGMPMKINADRVIGASLAAQDLLVLFGRDLLSNFTLFYNGANGEFTISF